MSDSNQKQPNAQSNIQSKKSFSQTIPDTSTADGISAAIEVILNHPFWTFKNRSKRFL